MAEAIEYPDNTIPVTLMRGRPWYSGCLSWELCNMLNALEQPDLRIIGEGAVKKVGLDGRSRARDDNRLNLPKEEKRRITARKINKGLTMEMVMSSLLTFVDHPGAVTSRCVPNKRGLPNNFAQGGRPDIVFHPADNEPSFQVVCEVSANEEMDDSTYLGQLERGLEHARAEHQKTGVAVTYLFVANLRKIGEDKALQAVYRKFLTASGSRLGPMGRYPPGAHAGRGVRAGRPNTRPRVQARVQQPGVGQGARRAAPEDVAGERARGGGLDVGPVRGNGPAVVWEGTLPVRCLRRWPGRRSAALARHVPIRRDRLRNRRPVPRQCVRRRRGPGRESSAHRAVLSVDSAAA